jgi:beta-galactosidase
MGLGPPGTSVTLPHDALLGSGRSSTAGPATGYYVGGEWEYHRPLDWPTGAESVYLEFEGVYRDAIVYVNDNPVAHRPNGYVGFFVPVDHALRRDDANEIRVEARAQRDSRWYPGGGIYRSVWLLTGGRVHIVPEGLQVSTSEIDDDVAVLAVAVEVRNASASSSRARVRVEVLDESKAVVAAAEAPATTLPGDVLTVRQRLVVASPRRWSVEQPSLYTCRATLLDDGTEIDDESTTFGIRSLSLDPVRGLRINGQPVLLRGACVHHDNGPLGAATIDRAEERRVELLRAAGFNAIRSAHNPLSKAMLHACDRLGMLVMDETFDMWERPKTEYDYALRFPEWWERDVEAMVRKDINHPSVIFYSIGNEIPEAGTPVGSRRGRLLAELVRRLDPSRYVTEAVTGILMGGPELFEDIRTAVSERAEEDDGAQASSVGDVVDRLNQLITAPAVTRNAAETFSYLDVAGYNYMEPRYASDGEADPHRVLVGTETYPMAIDSGWAKVRALPHVIGDFTWTGWDYLGEAGIGRTEYRDPGADAVPGAFHGEYPWRTAWCGDFDITGHRRPQSFYREIVFGMRDAPAIAVRRPQHQGKEAASTPWAWTDSVASWSWDGWEGAPTTVEVYADADEVELWVNGRSLGTRPAGPAVRYRAEFAVSYEPGELEAAARRGGREIGRTSLRSARGPVQLAVEPDRKAITAHPLDLAFVSLTLVDQDGALYRSADRSVTVSLDGPGELQALGSANPCTEEGFGDPTCRTFDGRALAVVRPIGPGTIVITVTADGCDPGRAVVEAEG